MICGCWCLHDICCFGVLLLADLLFVVIMVVYGLVVWLWLVSCC